MKESRESHKLSKSHERRAARLFMLKYEISSDYSKKERLDYSKFKLSLLFFLKNFLSVLNLYLKRFWNS